MSGTSGRRRGSQNPGIGTEAEVAPGRGCGCAAALNIPHAIVSKIPTQITTTRRAVAETFRKGYRIALIRFHTEAEFFSGRL